ncbi:unnamed protein product [Porites evermanni]|uniref:G-protein coupled receptors family 1 profile domain-containing protein n=1 Tax=Porites evermanni TaxID=104178 RepID=A0ABN8T2A4_9CNID|nr:unnamed protein product [Porites evermanni]
MYVILGGRLEKPSPFAQVCLILNININIFTFPFTAVLNALVMIAVKTKRRLRAHKSNIAIALLATTDFVAASFAQHVFIAWLISILVNYYSDLCPLMALRFLINLLVGVSILHLLLISGERYLAIKHPFVHISLGKESNLLIASALAWLLPLILNVCFPLVENTTVFVMIDNTIMLLSVACIASCHFSVYLETRRHQRQIADQQFSTHQLNSGKSEKPSGMNASELMHHECRMYVILGGRLEKPSPFAQVCLILNININIFTFPFTAVLNALVMIAVKTKRRLRAHKSNIAIALLATTDFVAASFAQHVFIAWLISILVNYYSDLCPLMALRFLINLLVGVSILHLLLISGERYLAIKHPFVHISLVKESNLLIASALAWLLPLILNVCFPLVENTTVFVMIDNTIMLLSVACIASCHFSVYLETRRHQRQIADQQVTQETRKQLLKDKRAFKVTSLIVAAILLCSLPMIVIKIVITRFPSLVPLEQKYILFLSITSINLLNSFINPIIYRQYNLWNNNSR